MRNIKDEKKTLTQISIRVPNEMFKEIQKQAEQEHRSISAQILTIIETITHKKGDNS